MKIAIIGAGNVGATLGKSLAEVGHELIFGVANPEKYVDSELAGKITKVSEAANESAIILLAVPFNAVSEVLNSCGYVSGKIIINATNPLGMTENGLGLTLGFETSGAEKVAEVATNAKVVKCFNQTGAENMANPNGSMMFVCGDDSDAVETVRKLAEEIGFEAINFGKLKQARLLEPLAMTWIHLAINLKKGRNFTFKIQRS